MGGDQNWSHYLPCVLKSADSSLPSDNLLPRYLELVLHLQLLSAIAIVGHVWHIGRVDAKTTHS